MVSTDVAQGTRCVRTSCENHALQQRPLTDVPPQQRFPNETSVSPLFSSVFGHSFFSCCFPFIVLLPLFIFCVSHIFVFISCSLYFLSFLVSLICFHFHNQFVFSHFPIFLIFVQRFIFRSFVFISCCFFLSSYFSFPLIILFFNFLTFLTPWSSRRAASARREFRSQTQRQTLKSNALGGYAVSS